MSIEGWKCKGAAPTFQSPSDHIWIFHDLKLVFKTRNKEEARGVLRKLAAELLKEFDAAEEVACYLSI